MSRIYSSLIVSGFASFLLVGCASDSQPPTAPPPQPKPTETQVETTATNMKTSAIGDFKADLVSGRQQVDATLASLAMLTDPKQADLRTAYNNYCDQLARMREHSEVVRTEADAMRASRVEYFANWEDKVTEIDNPTIRKSAEARRKRLRDAHEQIITVSGAAKDAYVPFMKDLEDIRKYLANDLSKSAIADLSDAVKKVQVDGAVVKTKINAVIQTLDSIETGG